MQSTKNIYLFLFDTLSDWEIGYVTAGINNPDMQLNPKQYKLQTFSIDGKPIRTIGGLHVIPDIRLSEITTKNAAMLILPGGKSWDTTGNKEVLPVIKEFYKHKIPLAAICGATLGLAKSGILNSVSHTSNAKEYLLATNYQGSSIYSNDLCVNDNSIITASGTAPLEFAREIFKELHLYKPKVLEAWYKLFKTGSPEAFAELIKAQS